MFVHSDSDLYLADTNQPGAYSGPGETKDVDRITNCNWWPRQEKQLVLMFVHRWRGGTKWLTCQGGFVEPLEPPLDPQLKTIWYSFFLGGGYLLWPGKFFFSSDTFFFNKDTPPPQYQMVRPLGWHGKNMKLPSWYLPCLLISSFQQWSHDRDSGGKKQYNMVRWRVKSLSHVVRKGLNNQSLIG